MAAKKKASKKTAKKVAKKKVAKKKAKHAVYDVLVNQGNSPGAGIHDLEELAEIAARELRDPNARQVTLTVKVCMVQGDNGACRADGVK